MQNGAHPLRVSAALLSNYLTILVTRPAPTVRPPSRIANRRPSSMATGWISFTKMLVLLPGITISVPSGHVGGAEVELRTVVVEERRVPAALVLGQDVDLALELRVRRGGARLGHNLAALDVLTLHTAQQQPDVVAGLALVEQLAEHLHTGDGRLGGGGPDADDLDFLVDVDHATLHTTGDHGATAGDGEDVLDGHQERLVGLADRVRNRLVDGVHQLLGGRDPLRVAIERLQCGDPHDRSVLVELLGG